MAYPSFWPLPLGIVFKMGWERRPGLVPAKLTNWSFHWMFSFPSPPDKQSPGARQPPTSHPYRQLRTLNKEGHFKGGTLKRGGHTPGGDTFGEWCKCPTKKIAFLMIFCLILLEYSPHVFLESFVFIPKNFQIGFLKRIKLLVICVGCMAWAPKGCEEQSQDVESRTAPSLLDFIIKHDICLICHIIWYIKSNIMIYIIYDILWEHARGRTAQCWGAWGEAGDCKVEL